MQRSQEQQLSIGIGLKTESFATEAGIFAQVYAGQLTEIVKTFTEKSQPISQNDILQLLVQQDKSGRTPIDLATYLNYKNITMYLLQKLGKPDDFIIQDLNVDGQGRHCYHIMCYKGNYDCLITMLNFERESLKKVIFDKLYTAKQLYRLKNLDIKQGSLVSTVFHDADTIRRHLDFNSKATNLFSEYADNIIERYGTILHQQDGHGRNPLHYAAMSKFTQCYKCIRALLTIGIDDEPEYDYFLKLYFDIIVLDKHQDSKIAFDPRKSHNLLKEFEHLLDPKEFDSIHKDFKQRIMRTIREALNMVDNNQHTPLHIASYFGDFKASRFMVDLGADSTNAYFKERPLEVSRDKFARGVLQNLNEAAIQANSKDLKYLVNCGEKIDNRFSITGEAPIHKVVLSVDANKTNALGAIIQCNANLDILDSNGWTALHHASYNGDLDSAKLLIEKGAKVRAFSNQERTALHFAAMKNHNQLIRLLYENKGRFDILEFADAQKCTPLHLACKKGALEAVALLLAFGTDIYAQDSRQWTPLHYAAYNGFPKVVKKLLTWEADRDPKLRDTRNSQNKIAFNISKNPETKLGFRIIWKAAREGDLDMVRILIREGQDPNEVTQMNRDTSLHLAAKNGHILIVRYLLEQGATPSVANRAGKRPLDFCLESLQTEKAKPTKFKKPPTGSLLDRLQKTQEILGDHGEVAAE